MKRKKIMTLFGVMMLGGLSLCACSVTTKKNNNTIDDGDSNIVVGDYVVSYYVNGTLYKNIGVTSGATLELIDVPEIEGYDVSWENVDLTNITKNITINAILTAKEYTITYMLKSATGATSLYKTETYKYGSEIASPSVEVEDGYIFGGWVNLPSTMTASNLTVTGEILEVSNTYDISLFAAGSVINISKSGAYKITGTGENVTFNTTQEVHLVLDNVIDTNLTTSFVTSTKVLTLSTTGENIISDNSSNTSDGIINSTANVSIIGDGTLNINNSNSSGAAIFTSNATTTISSSTLILNSAGTGIQAKKSSGSITITGGDITITSASASIKAKKDVTINAGKLNLTATSADAINADNVYVTDGNIIITAKQDGIQGDTLVDISGGIIDITTNGGKNGNAALTTSSSFEFEVADTSAFTSNEEYYGLYYLSGTTYIEITESNVSSYKNMTLYDKVGCKGIKSSSDILISGGEITINSLDDAIHSKVNATISGGTITIDSKCDGIYAEELLSISGGLFDISTTGTFYQSSSGSYKKSGSTYVRTDSGSYDLYTSTKGLKSDSTIQISGGTITTNTSDDAIHSDDYVLITSGTFNLTTLDDGIHADTTLDVGVSGAANSLIDIKVLSAFEGMESGTVNYYSGNVSIYATDDGINAGGGTSSSTGGDNFNTGGGRPGGFGGFSGQTTTTTSNYSINVYGGAIYVSVASGDTDAIDSNGSYKQTGGVVVSHNISSSGTATVLDTDGSATISGGVFIGLGKLETTPQTSGVTKKSISMSLSSSTNYTLKYNSNDLITFKLMTSYSSFTAIGESGTYTLSSSSGSSQTFTI